MLIPTPQRSRLVPTLLVIGALFFIVREPAKAADMASNFMNGFLNVAGALATFIAHLS
ncbi:hypothetical protein [Nonomuraea pusilla]|uniref:Uncharacterized protein n=1 Tax=Nonomuraea pusilla TaxID=46177 RepID=A0A1H8JHC2_9ACTN|nr:hypothetical protein [Nonomuraea pusilla]SEN80082.1 hypothetical protein SAMN05660976_08345 [Nonomuraea pusilla]